MNSRREEILDKLRNLPTKMQALVLKRMTRPGDAVEAIPTEDGGRLAPASHGQLGLWSVYQAEGPSEKYNMPSAYVLSNALDLQALVSSFRAVVERHETLRSRFIASEAEVYQEVIPLEEFEVEVVDLSGLSSQDRESRAQAAIDSNNRHCFELEKGPPFKVSILRFAADRHVVLLNAHHIVFDGWSKGILLKEVCAFYRYFTEAQQTPDVPRLKLQYRHFSRWERENRKIDDRVRACSDRLRAVDHVLGIGDRQRPNAPSGRGFAVPISVSASLKESLLACGRRQGATPFMTLLATYAIMLARYSQQTGILIGTPAQTRSRPELRDLIGYFLNTVVLKIGVDEKLTFSQLVARAREACADAYSFDDVPFHRIVEEINPPRDKSISPLFQAMFVLQVAGASTFSMPGLEVEQIESDRIDIQQIERSASPGASAETPSQEGPSGALEGSSKFDVYLTFIDEGEGRPLEGWLTYNCDILSPQTVSTWLTNFATLIERVSSEPDTPLWKLDALCARDRAVVARPGASREVAATSLSAQFERQVEQTPDAVALIHESTEVSYRQLNRLANRIADRLRREAIGPGDIVGLSLDRSPEMIASMLAAFKLGSAYVPLEPSLPDERLVHYIETSRPKLIVTAASAASRFERHVVKRLLIEELAGAGGGVESDVNPPQASHEQSLAYLLFTSGSTGSPKAVMATHAATLNRIFWGHRELPALPGDVFCHKTTCSFVDHVAEIFEPLLRGHPVVVAPKSKVMDTFQFVRLLRDHKVTQLTLVPSLLLSVLDHYPELGQTLPFLRRVICSGEALPPELASRFHSALPKAELLNVYGSTEVGADVSFCKVTPVAASGGSVPIGRPLDNCVVYVLDNYLNRCPAGVTGEVWVGGTQVSQGYYRDPSLTATCFVPDPHAGAGARMFRTRDLARYRHDGQLEYAGRKDNQVKVRGFRINLDEIQKTLIAHPDVKDAVVDVRVTGKDLRLVAYVVPEDASLYELDRSALRTFLAARLPDYMVPGLFVVLEALPLNPNGKVDRARLPAPVQTVDASKTLSPPTTETEKALASIWTEVLSVPEVDVEESFFELGGHSLSATRIATEVWEQFGVEIAVHDLFMLASVKELAAHIDELMRTRVAVS